MLRAAIVVAAFPLLCQRKGQPDGKQSSDTLFWRHRLPASANRTGSVPIDAPGSGSSFGRGSPHVGFCAPPGPLRFWGIGPAAKLRDGERHPCCGQGRYSRTTGSTTIWRRYRGATSPEGARVPQGPRKAWPLRAQAATISRSGMTGNRRPQADAPASRADRGAVQTDEVQSWKT